MAFPKVRINAIRALYPKGFLVQWTVDSANESGVYKFNVYRGGSFSGPWDLLAENLTQTYAFFDDFTKPEPRTTLEVLRPNQLNLFREYAYRVVCLSPESHGSEDISDFHALEETTLVERRMSQLRRKLTRDFALSLKFNGTTAVFLKRRRWGVRCLDCYDKYSRENMRASCTTCWGTTITGGYWAPYKTLARRNVNTDTSAIAPNQKIDSNDTKIWIPAYPNVEQDDVVVFLNDQKRYRLDQAVQTEVRLKAIHQVVSGQELAHDHILYRLPVNTADAVPLF